MRFPDPPIVGYPSRGARARWLGGGARGERAVEFCVREFRARARTARAGRRRAGTKGATAPYPYPRPRWALCVWRLTCGIDTVCPYEL